MLCVLMMSQLPLWIALTRHQSIWRTVFWLLERLRSKMVGLSRPDAGEVTYDVLVDVK